MNKTIEDLIKTKYKRESIKYGMKDRRSLFWTKDKQNMRFNTLLGEQFKNSKMSILDYGCGFSDLLKYLKQNFYSLQYRGCDINADFVKESLKRYPKATVFEISEVNDLTEDYDIVLVSGTFNLIGIDDRNTMYDYIFHNINTLFSHTKHMLTINFLSHLTDKEYQYKGHFYLDPTKLYNYAISHLTKRIRIDTSSIPYEITMKLYKNEKITNNSVIFDI